MGQQGIWPKFFGAAAELPGVTQREAHTAACDPNHAADSYVLVAILAQVTNLGPIRPGAYDSKTAFTIGQLRRAYIQEACPIGQFHDVVNVSRNADIQVRPE